MTAPDRLEALRSIYRMPFIELVRAQSVHRANQDPNDIQRCALLSIKTGGCAEDCAYCAQSARYATGVEAEPLLALEEVRARAQRGA